MKTYKISYVLLIILSTFIFSVQLNAQVKGSQKSFALFLENRLSIFAGINMSKQNINPGTYNSRFNYDLSNYQNNIFKSGYFFGFRIDDLKQLNNKYDFSVSLNKIVSGSNYKVANNLDPFLGSFSKFKADDNFFIMNINSHYKKQIFSDKIEKRKFYLVAGPSIDIRLSKQSEDNQVYNNYRNIALKADLGIEFDNQTYYTLFIHYKQAITSFTKQPITTNLNNFELGTIIKASDIF
jgi:hypothetical protein